jgi:DNA replication ATP-dependent helicase Dna2
MLPAAILPLFQREIEKITQQAEWSSREKVLALSGLMERAFFEATKQEQIAFSTFFARICYAGQRYNFPPDALGRIHQFRLYAKRVRMGGTATETMVEAGVTAVQATVVALTNEPAALSDEEEPTESDLSTQLQSNVSPRQVLRVLALRDVPQYNYLIARDEENPQEEIRIRYGVPDRNENFQPSIQVIRKIFGFPITLNLLEVEIDQAGYYIPRAIVVEPDYLVDVSAISECFKDTGSEPYSYLVRKFLPHETTEPILLGNIANFFLDRLLNEPEAEWQKLFLETFQLYPFIYAPMSDAQVKSIAGKAMKHFINLKNMATGGFKLQGIDPANCALEPAFFSNQYGIQGRLDLFFRKGDTSAIVELKSGTPFKPNSYGLSRSHFTQTLLYDLLVRSVFGQKTDPVKYILYSGVDVNHLRFAPTIVPEQREAIQVRNQLVAIERLLTKIQPGDDVLPIFNRLQSTKGQGFTARDFARFEKAYNGLSLLEKKYFNAFTGFIAREHWLAKVGEENSDTMSGHASLWRGNLDDKLLNFNILSHLKILKNRADQPDPNIIFQKTDQTNSLANFRVGDIAVLYPARTETDTVLQHQIIKCTITKLENDCVEIQLRFRQHNLTPFDTDGFWCLEPDMLDSGFVSMYRGLLEWAESAKELREKIMGASIQVQAAPYTTPPATLTEKICTAPDFFLLWGPPGTGKTSVMLRDIAHWVMQNTTENLLILAYTNRAVDEICDALDSIGGDIREQYLRIGGKHAAANRFAHQLLSSKISTAANRADLRAVLERHRIFVSTVASFSQNEGLLKLKKFQRLVVDEASQILEPQLVGLLTRFEHFTLIGDHRQLPAVTAQRPENTLVKDPHLNSIGIVDLRDSYFERLFLLCKKNGWHWAYDQLGRQGRMHEAIMDFPGKWFYEGNLEVLNKSVQQAAIHYILPEKEVELGKIIALRRMVFLPVTSTASQTPGQKTSAEEAQLCTRMVSYFQTLWKTNQKPWEPEKSLGIITPWRAQIAQIRAVLAEAGIDPNDITVDTVERYQGGARDVIIISTCANSVWQLNALLNISNEGVDRKLNVALTRAREHLIMLGNPQVLQQDERYQTFIQLYGVENLPAG